LVRIAEYWIIISETVPILSETVPPIIFETVPFFCRPHVMPGCALSSWHVQVLPLRCVESSKNNAQGMLLGVQRDKGSGRAAGSEFEIAMIRQCSNSREIRLRAPLVPREADVL